MQVFDDILETVGNTPLVKLNKLNRGLKPTILLKLEYYNPGSSVKDRIAMQMLEDAVAEGKLKPGGTIIESTSGNTGLGLAIAASVKGYKCIFTMPDKMSSEKIDVLRAFGAKVVVTPTAVEPDDPKSYYSVAKQLEKEVPNSLYMNQYFNESNPRAHYKTTGPEIWEQTDGKITHFVASMGTGGTISGTGKYLKEQSDKVKIIGSDPKGSLYYQFFKEGTVGKAEGYLVEGIGEDIFPSTMDFKIVDDVIQVTDKECFSMARKLARDEGIFAGGSAGAAVAAALRLAETLTHDDIIVVIIPDTGSRYLSKVYNDDWLKENRMLDTTAHMNAYDVLLKKKTQDLVSVEKDVSVAEAIKKMKAIEISQLPVMEGNKSIGTLHERRVIDLLINQADLGQTKVSEVMDESMPEVDESAAIDDVRILLGRGVHGVLIRRNDNSKPLGIITTYDLLHSLDDI